jgi:biotin synthase
MTTAASRHDWTRAEVEALYERPLNDLLFDAQDLHRRHFDPNRVQISTLLSVKTGACPEDCAYCPQSVHHNTGLERERLLPLEEVVASAKAAQAQGATRFCMGAAWRNPTDRNLERVIEMIQAVRDLGMETCVTLGMLREEQARRLAEAGLDYYNHNLDSSPEYYEQVISTRSYSDRQETLANARAAGLNVCCGGIVGMGERRNDRAGLLVELANQATHPGSVPINMLIQVPGTPLYGVERLDPIEFVRTIAVARLMMPQSYVRLSAGRTDMSDETQALCFFAGANSIFYGEKLLTTENPETEADAALFARLGIQAETAQRERAAGPSMPATEPAP